MLRPTLGDFSSIVCFKAIITGMEETLGENATAIALTAAGRLRGKKLAQELNLYRPEIDLDFAALTSKIEFALGKEGTRLCQVDKIEQVGNAIRVYTAETVCSAGEPSGSNRRCTYTLGAVWGVLEQILNQRLQGKQIESVLQKSSHDVFEFIAVQDK